MRKAEDIRAEISAAAEVIIAKANERLKPAGISLSFDFLHDDLVVMADGNEVFGMPPINAKTTKHRLAKEVKRFVESQLQSIEAEAAEAPVEPAAPVNAIPVVEERPAEQAVQPIAQDARSERRFERSERAGRRNRHERSERAEKSDRRRKIDAEILTWCGAVLDRLHGQVRAANRKLEELVANAGIDMSSVAIGLSLDSAGIYVYSGETPAFAYPRVGRPETVFDKVKDGIWNAFDATRSAIEFDATKKRLADQLEASVGSVARRMSAADEQIVDCVEQSVRSANRTLEVCSHRAMKAAYGTEDAKFEISGFSGGVVVSLGGKPCSVINFPRYGSNFTVEKTLKFIPGHIAAMAESRRKYLAKVETAFQKEELLHEYSAQLDELQDKLVAIA